VDDSGQIKLRLSRRRDFVVPFSKRADPSARFATPELLSEGGPSPPDSIETGVKEPSNQTGFAELTGWRDAVIYRDCVQDWQDRTFCVWKSMPKAPAAKSRQRSEEEILDQATQQLLRAAKEQAEKSGKPMNRESLRQDGYSDRFIEKVRDA
jgi:hypothetical protein